MYIRLVLIFQRMIVCLRIMVRYITLLQLGNRKNPKARRLPMSEEIDDYSILLASPISLRNVNSAVFIIEDTTAGQAFDQIK